MNQYGDESDRRNCVDFAFVCLGSRVDHESRGAVGGDSLFAVFDCLVCL